eukprot:SAG31_NODE_3495_length_4199_cov_2.274878_3_plen_408_part_00
MGKAKDAGRDKGKGKGKEKGKARDQELPVDATVAPAEAPAPKADAAEALRTNTSAIGGDDVGDGVAHEVKGTGKGKGKGKDKGKGKGEEKGKARESAKSIATENLKKEVGTVVGSDAIVRAGGEARAAQNAQIRADKMEAMRAKMAALSTDYEELSVARTVSVVEVPSPQADATEVGVPAPTVASRLSLSSNSVLSIQAPRDLAASAALSLRSDLASRCWLTRLQAAELRLALAVACDATESPAIRRQQHCRKRSAKLSSPTAGIEYGAENICAQKELRAGNIFMHPRGMELRRLALQLITLTAKSTQPAERGSTNASGGHSPALQIQCEDVHCRPCTGWEWWHQAVAQGNKGMAAIDQLLTVVAAVLSLKGAPLGAARAVGMVFSHRRCGAKSVQYRINSTLTAFL